MVGENTCPVAWIPNFLLTVLLTKVMRIVIYGLDVSVCVFHPYCADLKYVHEGYQEINLSD